MEEKNKELIIDENTNLRKIKNKEDYTKLVLNREVSNRFLSSFPNIKDLTIDSFIIEENNYNEVNLNKISFLPKLEKLSFKNIESIGILLKNSRIIRKYSLNTPSLKSIELPSEIECINKNYLENSPFLEKIILNIDKRTIHDNLYVNETNLKEIIINTDGESYTVRLDYDVKSIEKFGYYHQEKYSYLYLRNYNYETAVIIKDKKINIENRLIRLDTSFVKDGCLYIPDFVDRIRKENTNILINSNQIKELSINTKILKSEPMQIILNATKFLEKIILRTNNDMQLFGNKEFNIKEYGEVKSVYIQGNKLCIMYKDFTIKIDETGKLIKKEQKKEEKENIKKIQHEFDKYTKDELIDYLLYKRLLEIIKNIKLDKNNKYTVNEVTDEIVKELIKSK